MNAVWRAFEDELARWRDSGREVELWWRDDDACRLTPALTRLLELAAAAQMPLALAVVPEGAEAGWLGGLPAEVEVLQHGVDHRNRASPSEKKTEFAQGESLHAALERLRGGQARLAALAQGHFLPVLAPPWNRLPAQLTARLPRAGFRGLSTYGVRSAVEPAPGLRQVNTHVDLIAWRQGRGFVGEEAALQQAAAHLAAQRAGRADPSEPTGWLTHHACHDEAAWTFLARLFERTRRATGVRWRRASELFDGVARA
ncbi:MAG: hypothetical protein M0015_07990 [Betaproteobacteria bacterium]|nr:hypothetical protein [Betaproteobacteria bacterium]